MTDLFDVRLWLYPGANPQADPATWEPFAVDISSYIRHPGNDGGSPIAYTGGKQDEANGVDSGQMALTLDNRDGRFSTENVLGPYYGLLDLNTPIRMGVRSWVDNFSRTLSNDWGTVDAAQQFLWNTTGPIWNVDGSKGTVTISIANAAVINLAARATSKDVDITTTAIPAALSTGAATGAGIFVRRTDNNNLAYGTVEFNTAGNVTVKIRQIVGGVVTELAAVNPIPATTYTAGQSWKIRVQADGAAIRAMVWPAAGAPPTTWHVTGVLDGSLVGASQGVYAVRFSGNTNSGVVPFVAFDDYAVTAMEFTGGVISWPLRWDITGNNSWAPITAAGILRRLNQGTNPILSPLRRQLAGTATVTGYWPLEDGAAAKGFGSVVAINQAGNFAGVTPAQDNTLPGGGPAPAITTTGGQLGFVARQQNGGTGMAVMFFGKLPSLPATKTRIARIRTSRGPIPFYDLSLDVTGIYTEGYAADGITVIISIINALPAVDFTQWFAWCLTTDTTTSPGNTHIEAITHQVGLPLYWVQSGNSAGSTNSCAFSLVLTGPSSSNFAHVWFGQNTLPFAANSFSLVSSGYSGELASDRFARVCTESGIPYTVRPGTSEAMGPQPKGSTLNILRACEAAEYGAIAERGAGLEFYPRSVRWNLATRMNLDRVDGEIGEAPEPVRDDQRLVNRFTMSRTDGGSATFQDDASVARQGTWESSGTVNVADDTVLPNHAAWRVNVGIAKAARLPSISANFGRNRLLAPFWRARDYGFRLGVTTGTTQMVGSEPDVIVEGFQAALWPNGWTVSMNCSSAAVWRSAVADDTGIYGRVDSDACTLSAGINVSTLTIAIVTTTGQLKWDNTAGLWTAGVDFNVGGERVTVTSITNGAGNAQTLNATARGVNTNGVGFAHSSGASVSLWDPAVVGF